jgi:RNA polymerase sigma-70 factor, ECF subfamily
VLADPHEAEDAAQEATLRAWRQRGACRSPEAPQAWFARIARNEALREGERGRRRLAEPLDEAQAAPDRVSEGLEERLAGRYLVDSALAQLSAEERRLVRLRYELDWTQVAIARRLEIPESTVRVRLHRIRHRLRALLGDYH